MATQYRFIECTGQSQDVVPRKRAPPTTIDHLMDIDGPNEAQVEVIGYEMKEFTVNGVTYYCFTKEDLNTFVECKIKTYMSTLMGKLLLGIRDFLLVGGLTQRAYNNHFLGMIPQDFFNWWWDKIQTHETYSTMSRPCRDIDGRKTFDGVIVKNITPNVISAIFGVLPNWWRAYCYDTNGVIHYYFIHYLTFKYNTVTQGFYCDFNYTIFAPTAVTLNNNTSQIKWQPAFH
ncbi:hypothetical protein AKO1_014885 [Acrasis kona]|uniref:Uncharacterized protein n=1 Tax=Acrasis kona TaxID=1008807 RepID=A0AAW2Z0N8_9EUKA